MYIKKKIITIQQKIQKNYAYVIQDKKNMLI